MLTVERPTQRIFLRVARLVSATLLAGAIATALAGCGHSFRGAVFDPPRQPYDFTLTDHTGAPWRLAEQRDRVVVVYFGFASCPDVCPKSLAVLAAARRTMGPDGARVQGALVSLDPDRDTFSVLNHYVKAFDQTFVGLRGDQADLEPILAAYSVTAYRRDLPGSAFGYTIDHTSFFYAFDLGGCYREMFKGTTPVEDLAGDLRALATERQPRTCR